MVQDVGHLHGDDALILPLRAIHVDADAAVVDAAPHGRHRVPDHPHQAVRAHSILRVGPFILQRIPDIPGDGADAFLDIVPLLRNA